MMANNYGVVAEHAAPRKGYSDFVQHTGPMVSGQLPVTFGYLQAAYNSFGVEQTLCRRNPRMQIKHGGSWINSLFSLLILTLRNPLILSTFTVGGSWLNLLIIPQTCNAVSRYNLLNVSGNAAGVCRETKHEQYSGSAEHNHYLDSGKEKGNAANAAYEDGCFFSHQENQHLAEPQGNRKPNLAYEQNQYLAEPQDNLPSLSDLVQPFGSMPRLSNSRRRSLFIQPDLLSSPSSFIARARRSDNSLSSLSCTTWRSLFSTVDIVNSCGLVCNGVDNVLHCMTFSKAKPGSVSPLTGPLTTNDRSDIEVAMLDHITPLTGRNSLTPNKFTWRFLALNRHDRKAKPCRLSVEAYTEREARRELAPHFILSLAARLPVQGIRETMTPSIIGKTSTVQEVSHA